jgi:hypothetical protein
VLKGGAAAVLAALLLCSCDGLFSGTEVARFPLQSRPQGGYAPVRLALGPQMNPIALNFAAEYTVSPAESGKWNSYSAVLSRGGQIVGATSFNINNPTTPDAPGGAPSVTYTMMVLDVGKTADYELAISATAPSQITLKNPNLELRRNLRRDAR